METLLSLIFVRGMVINYLSYYLFTWDIFGLFFIRIAWRSNIRISFTELSNVFRWVGDLSEVIPFAAPVNCALSKEPELSILLDVDLIVREVYIVGDVVHLQCFF